MQEQNLSFSLLICLYLHRFSRHEFREKLGFYFIYFTASNVTAGQLLCGGLFRLALCYRRFKLDRVRNNMLKVIRKTAKTSGSGKCPGKCQLVQDLMY